MDIEIYKIMKKIYEKENENAEKYKKFEVDDVQYIGIIETAENISGVDTKIIKDVYKVIERMEDGSIVENYYDEKIECIAGRNKDGQMYPAEKEIWKDLNISEKIAQLENENEKENFSGVSLNEMRKIIKAVAKQLGKKEEEIEEEMSSILEIDLEQKIGENNQKQDNQEEQKNDQQEISEEKIQKAGITGMNSVDLNSLIDTKGTTLGEELNMKEYSKLVVVPTYQLSKITNENGENGKINRLQMGLVAQKTDGTYETIPESKLKVYRGMNKRMLEIDNEENANIVHEENIYEVPGTDKRIVISQKEKEENPFGRPQVYLARNTRDNDGNIAEKVQDRYAGKHTQDVAVRELFNRNKGKDQTKKMKDEAMENVSEGEENVKLEKEDYDGDENTLGTLHEGSNELQTLIEEIVQQFPDVERAFTKGEIGKRIIKLYESKELSDREKLITTVGEDLEEDARHVFHTKTLEI